MLRLHMQKERTTQIHRNSTLHLIVSTFILITHLLLVQQLTSRPFLSLLCVMMDGQLVRGHGQHHLLHGQEMRLVLCLL